MLLGYIGNGFDCVKSPIFQFPAVGGTDTHGLTPYRRKAERQRAHASTHRCNGMGKRGSHPHAMDEERGWPSAVVLHHWQNDQSMASRGAPPAYGCSGAPRPPPPQTPPRARQPAWCRMSLRGLAGAAGKLRLSDGGNLNLIHALLVTPDTDCRLELLTAGISLQYGCNCCGRSNWGCDCSC